MEVPRRPALIVVGSRRQASDAGIVAITFGMMFSLLVGTGVMTLVFFDDRRG